MLREISAPAARDTLSGTLPPERIRVNLLGQTVENASAASVLPGEGYPAFFNTHTWPRLRGGGVSSKARISRPPNAANRHTLLSV